MATVYRAVQHSLGRAVAIKVLARGPDDQDEFALRFKKEGRILARLLHPNIVTIYDIGVSEDNQLFLSMEYLSDGTLRDRIKRGLSFDSTIHIVRSIAKALGYAHEKGVIHRDVKPSNIMFRHDGTPVLTDFGVARVVTGSSTVHTMTGLTVGSPGYMSPEQAMGQGATLQSDLYSLGVVLYEMLVGHPPYQADSSLAVVLKHLHDPIPSLPREHANLQSILNKLLAKKSTDRYRDVGEFLAALNFVIPSDTGSQPKATTGGSPLAMVEFASGTLRSLWLKRPRRFLWLGMIGASVLLIVVVYAFRSRTATESSETLPEPPQPVANTAPVSRETEIATLLQQAEARLQAGLLTDEAEQSAEAAYRRVLKLDRGNAQALAGLENIAREYERLARQRLESGAPRESLDPIQKGLAVAPGREGLLRLRQEAERKIIERQAQEAERERQQELRLQAEQYLENARSSFAEGLLEISQAHIEQGLQAVPDHPDLLALRDQVKARMAETAQRRAEEARRQAEEAERRKTEKARQQAAAKQRRQEADQSLAQAAEAQRKSDYAASSQFIEQGLEKVPNHEGLLRLREAVARGIAEAKARQEREEEQRLHAELFFAQARSSFQQGALEASLTQIEQGLAVMAGHPGLLALRDQVKARIAEQARQEAEAARQQEEAARRQAEEAERQQTRRADQAKREQEINTLLKQADTQMQAKRLTEPTGNNAEVTYRQVLKLDVGNAQAQAGLERIAQEYLQQARQRRSGGALQESLKLIEQGLAVLPKQAELLRLR
ncbi:MAG: protein kinase, partial [Candidatus Contendobacter sp.]